MELVKTVLAVAAIIFVSGGISFLIFKQSQRRDRIGTKGGDLLCTLSLLAPIVSAGVLLSVLNIYLGSE